MISASLIEHLRQVEDFRTTDGRRHPLWLVLLFVIMGTMSGYVGYPAWGDFVKRHPQELIKRFGIQKHGVPSYSTIRRVVMGIENRLHWVKDVVFKEDDSKIRLGHAAANLSVLRAIALNILRRNGHTSITTAHRFLSHDLDKLLLFMK